MEKTYQEVSETYPINPCSADSELLEILGSRRYDHLNGVIKNGVCQTYRYEMLPQCNELLENERMFGRIVSNDESKDNEGFDDENWFKDPEKLNTFELFKEISKLSMRLEKQKKLNARSQADIELLGLAKKSLDLELGFKLVELISEEKKYS